MRKKTVVTTIVILAIILLDSLAIVGGLYHHGHQKNEFPYEVDIDFRTKVTWQIDEIPNRLPVYTAKKSADQAYMWRNILDLCGFTDSIMFSNNISFSSEDWQVSVDEDGEVRCWYKDRNFDDNTIVQLSYPELEERAVAFLSQLGLNMDNYYISAYPINPDGEYKIFEFSYRLSDYKAAEWPSVLSLSYMGEQLTDLSIRFEDIKEYGTVYSISIYDIKEVFKSMTFYMDSTSFPDKYTARNLTITGVDITYIREEDKLVPYLCLVGNVYDEPLSIDVVSNRIKAYDSAIYKNSDTSEVDTENDTIKNIKSLYNYAMSCFENRDFKTASSYFESIVDNVEESEVNAPELNLLKHQALLYESLSEIQLGIYASSFDNLEKCKDYFRCAVADEYITVQELDILRIYNNLALAHLYTILNSPVKAGECLTEVNALIESYPHDIMTELFYLYEKAYISPSDADELWNKVVAWENSDSASEEKYYSYYAPLMKIMAARAYLESNPDKAYDIIENNLMNQGVAMGSTAEEKLRILAETNTLFADYLETLEDRDSNFDEILTYRTTAASLWESLMLASFDRVMIDGVYYRQTGEAYYDLAVLYAESGQIDSAIWYLEQSLTLLSEMQIDSFATLFKAWELGVELYSQIGDSTNADKYAKNLDYCKSDLPKIWAEYIPVDLAELIPDEEKTVSYEANDDREVMIVSRENEVNGIYPKMHLSDIALTEKGKENPALVKAVGVLSAALENRLSPYIEKASSYYLHCLANGFTMLPTLYMDIYITRWDENVISVLMRVDYLTSGPHELTTYHTLNYSMADEKLLDESEIIGAETYEEAFRLLQESYADKFLSVDTVTSDNSEVILTPMGYTFVFNPGVCTAYVNGAVSVTVPYEKESGYTSSTSFVSEIPPYAPFTAVDGVRYEVLNYVEKTTCKGFCIERNGTVSYIETEFTLSSYNHVYYTHSNGKDYILFQNSSEDKVYVYLLAEDGSIQRNVVAVTDAISESDTAILQPIYTDIDMLTNIIATKS